MNIHETLESYLIPTTESFNIKAVGVKISSQIKNLWNKLALIFKKNNEIDEEPAQEGIFGNLFKSNSKINPKQGSAEEWILNNADRLLSNNDYDAGNVYYIPTADQDNSDAAKLLRDILQVMKENAAWGKEVPLMTMIIRNAKKSAMIAKMRADWNSMTVVMVGVPMLTLSQPVNDILANFEKGKHPKVEASIILESHWSIDKPDEVITTDHGNRVAVICSGAICI